MGASLMHALQRAGVAESLMVIDTKDAHRQYAAHYADAAFESLDEAWASNVCNGKIISHFMPDWVIIATPMQAMASVLKELNSIAHHFPSHCIFSDIASSKNHVFTQVTQYFGTYLSQYISIHPIAGSEQQGPHAANPELFQQKPWVITPFRPHLIDDSMMLKMQDIAQQLHADVYTLDVAEHDAIFSKVSHLPHALMFALLHYLAKQPDILKLSGGGLKDSTRIGAAGGDIWQSILSSNAQHIVADIDGYIASLQQLRSHLILQEDAALHAYIDEARQTYSHLRSK